MTTGAEPVFDATRCQNCGQPLAAAQSYCSHCGQRAVRGRLTLHEVWHDLVHSLFHVDRSALSLLRALLARPGTVAREYVEGMRRRYFGPFGFLVVSVSLAAAAIAASGLNNVQSDSVAASPLAQLLQRHINLLYLLQVPLIAWLSALMFRREGRNFAEHLVLAAYTSGMRAIAIVVLLVPLWLLLDRSQDARMTLFGGYFAIWVLYYAASCAQFFDGGRIAGFLKGATVALIAQGLTLLAFSGVYSLLVTAMSLA